MTVLIALALACGTEDAPDARPREAAARGPVVVIGIDGASHRLFERYAAKGSMPAIAGLAKRGSAGVLESIAPALSPRIWTSIATGVRPERHGILGFMKRVPGRPMSTLVPVTERQVPAIWNVAGDAGKKVGVVGWWVTWPAERVNGFMVSHTLFQGRAAQAATFPASLGARIDALARGGLDPEAAMRSLVTGPLEGHCPAGLALTAGDAVPSAERDEGREAWLCNVVEEDVATVEIARTLAREERPDVLFVLLRSVDVASHGLWKYAFPDEATWTVPPTPEEIRMWGGAIEGVHRLADRLVARLLDGLGASTVLVVSDHGFGADADGGGRYVRYHAMLEDLGWLATRGDVVDWTKTVVVHDDANRLRHEGALWLNLVERSPQGIVPASELAAKAAAIAASLRAVTTAEGTPFFREVTARTERAPGDGEPDVVLVPSDDAMRTASVHLGGKVMPASRYVFERDANGSHVRGRPEDLEGLVVAAGPGIARHRAPIRASVLDVAPTLACLLDLSLPIEPDGHPSPAILDRAVLAGCDVWSGGTAPAPSTSSPASAFPDDERLREQLRGLGYVE